MGWGKKMTTNKKPNSGDIFEVVADERAADVLFINSDVYPPLDLNIIQMVCDRKKRENIIVILVTNGGLPDVSYRIARCLQKNYKSVTVVISGWCKSAGTILCTGANELVFGMYGELGPIDVQIRREDEIGERDSGLSVESAFESLRMASFRLFEQCMYDIKEHSYGSITFKTAAEIASSMAVGMVSPIFAQLDPIKIGETHRSVRIAEEYAKRLAMHSHNLRKTPEIDPIEILLRGYPTHGFVIDKDEASFLFRNVSDADGNLQTLIEALGKKAIIPTESPSGGQSIVEFLNEEPRPQPKKPKAAKASKGTKAAASKKSGRRKTAARANGASAAQR